MPEPRWSVLIAGRLRLQWAGAVVVGLLSVMAAMVALMLLGSAGFLVTGSSVPRFALALGPVGFLAALAASGRAGRGTLRYDDGALRLELGHRSALALRPERSLPLLDATLELAPGGSAGVLRGGGERWRVGTASTDLVRLDPGAFESFAAAARLAITELARRRDEALERARSARPPALPLRLATEAADTVLELGEAAVELRRGGQVVARLQLPLARASARNTYRSAGKRRSFDGPAVELVDSTGRRLRIRAHASRPWLRPPGALWGRPDCVLPREGLDPLCRWLAHAGVLDETLLLRDALSFDLGEVLAGVVRGPSPEPEPERAQPQRDPPAPRREITPRDGYVYMALGGLFLGAGGLTWLLAPRLVGDEAWTVVITLAVLGAAGVAGGLLHRLGLVRMDQLDD